MENIIFSCDITSSVDYFLPSQTGLIIAYQQSTKMERAVLFKFFSIQDFNFSDILSQGSQVYLKMSKENIQDSDCV